MPGDQRDFFVSYTGRDEAWATWVARQLEQAGYRTVVQAWDFGAGNFIVAMEDAVRRCRRLLPIVSEAYLRARYGRLEWSPYLRENPALVIPILIEDIETRSLLGPQARVNLVGLGAADAAAKLLRDIAAMAGKPEQDSLVRGPDPFFPGVAPQVAPRPPDSAGPGTAEAPPRRVVEIDRARMRLVVLGAGAEHRPAAAALPDLLALPGDQVLDLYDDGAPGPSALHRLTAHLGELSPEEVSDVVVAFAGRFTETAGSGVRLQLRDATILLGGLFDVLLGHRDRFRLHVVVDAAGGDGPLGPIEEPPAPVLVLGAAGAAGLRDLLRLPPDQLTERVRHRDQLTAADLADLTGGTLWAAGAHAEVARTVGLAPNPLAWPAGPPESGANWCFVKSESGSGQETIALVFDQLAEHSGGQLNRALGKAGAGVELSARPGILRAGAVLGSPASFAAAVDQVCRAEIAVFDLTDYEPAVMVLLGIRAVIRRGVTVCVTGDNDPPWDLAEPPFHLREIGLMRDPARQRLEQRIRDGIRQRAGAGERYADLPSFDLIRAVPPLDVERARRPYDSGENPTILALVPFDPEYTARSWRQIRDNLQGAALASYPDSYSATEPMLRRTLDLDSPRVISAQLFEAIRLTDFCLVDLTSARPNVLFELGVRLAANDVHPVVVVDPSYPRPDADDPWWRVARPQWEQLRELLQAIVYAPGDVPVFAEMVARHRELRTLLRLSGHPRAMSILHGLPPTGVYELAWRHAVDTDEGAVTPVQTRLRSAAETLLLDPMGRRHMVYPPDHPLTARAERCGREHLVAAFLYLHFRLHDGHPDRAAEHDEYHALAVRLISLLDETGEPADAAFARRIEQWLDISSAETEHHG